MSELRPPKKAPLWDRGRLARTSLAAPRRFPEEATGTVAVPGCAPYARPSFAMSRSTALSTAFSEAITILGSMPTPWRISPFASCNST